MGVEASEVEFIRARSDKREYRRVVLPNALEVLLVSDPDTDKAAACMEVAVGSFSEPAELAGLAHFLEHMLFYASEKYPEEDDYSKYISEHGGSCNAATYSETTEFYFDVNVDNLEEALDRFAQFFIKPLMSSDAVLREIKAVDSEHKNNLMDDGCRMFQLEKHLASKDHPYHRFDDGNWETLETRPKERGLDIRLELLKFYENYSANLMHLVVYGKENLDCIQSLVERLFCDVKNTDQIYFKCPGQPLVEEHLQLLVKAIPVEEGDHLKIAWPVTPWIHCYKEGVHDYLNHLIGHEGKGSIFHIIKELGWAMSLDTEEESDSTEYSFFSVSMRLTEAGHEHVEDIVGLVFEYIELLKRDGIHKWIFEEIAAISEMEFHYQDKCDPISYVVDIASAMRIFPPDEWLVGGSLPSKYAPDRIKMVLDEMCPDRVRIFWASKIFEGSTNSVEPWYGTSYCVEKVTPSIIQHWMEKAPSEGLHLPKTNPFIPKDFSLKDVQEKVKFPSVLRETSLSRLWYKAANMFSTPKAYIVIDFHCPLSNHSPQAALSTSLFVDLLEDYLNDYTYDAQIAGLSYCICCTSTGFQVIAAGYNHKMKVLLDAVIKQIADFEVDPDRFSAFKETSLEDYRNFKFSQPCSQASYYLSLILGKKRSPWADNLEALSELEEDFLNTFLPHMLSRTFVECYIQGNIEPSEAESIAQEIEDVLFNMPNSMFHAMSPSQHLTDRTVMLEGGLKCYYQIEGLNQKDENSSLIQYIQVHQNDATSDVKVELFSFIASQPAFNQLRTVEQLGYMTSLSLRFDSGVRALEVTIQSTVKDPSYLDTRVDEFSKTFESKIFELSEEDFKRNVKALIDLKLEKFKNLWEEAGFFWGQINRGALNFNIIESEVSLLRELKKEEFVEFFDRYIKVDAPERRTLSVQVFGGNHLAEYKKAVAETDPPKTYRIVDIFDFRRSRPLCPSLKWRPPQIAPQRG